jgi:hypothetical protein
VSKAETFVADIVGHRFEGVLYLDNNRLSGNIPQSIGKLSNLGKYTGDKNVRPSHRLIFFNYPNKYSGFEIEIESGK